MLFSGLVLFLTALLHEDVAIVTAAFFVVQQGLPLPFALAVVYVGVLANNALIYGLGKVARRLPKIRRLLVGERVERARRKLERHLVPAVLLCRLTPGLLYPTFLACGWLGIPFLRFAVLAAVAPAVYVPVMLMLVVTFGDVVLQRLSEWAWTALAVIVIAIVIVAARNRMGNHRQRDS